jgi:hypothetical protein
MAIDFSNTNDLWKKLFGIQMQKQMADMSLERQLEYLERSNSLYGERESSRIKQAGEKEKDVAAYKHGLDLDKLAQENAYWIARQPGVKRLMNIHQTTQDPAVKTQIEGTLDKFATIFGTVGENSLKGKPPSADEMAVISEFVDPKEAITYFNGVSVNVRGFRTAGIQQQQADTQRMKVNAEGGGKAGKKENDLNAILSSRATETMAYLTGKGGEAGETVNEALEGGAPAKGVDQKGRLRRMVSKIKSMAGQGKFKDQAIAQSYFDFLDAVYENPAEATKMLGDIEATKDANVGLGKERIRRKALPPGTPTATNPETGEVVAYIDGKWQTLK